MEYKTFNEILMMNREILFKAKTTKKDNPELLKVK